MSEMSILHDRLNLLVNVTVDMSGRERILMRQGEGNLRAAMRVEISETQLPRRLVFRNDKGGKLCMEVASGRIRKFSPPHDQEDPSHWAELVASFAEGANRLSVETERLETAFAAHEVGLALDAVFPPLASDKVAVDAPEKRDIVTAFLQASQEICTSGLALVAGQVMVEFGADGPLATLYDLVELEELEPQYGDAADQFAQYPTQCVIYSGHPVGGQSVLCVSADLSLGFATVDNAFLGQIIALWKSFAG